MGKVVGRRKVAWGGVLYLWQGKHCLQTLAQPIDRKKATHAICPEARHLFKAGIRVSGITCDTQCEPISQGVHVLGSLVKGILQVFKAALRILVKIIKPIISIFGIVCLLSRFCP